MEVLYLYFGHRYISVTKPCGAIIDNKHRIFDDFPTEKYPDYQWKRLLDNSVGTDISKFAGEVKPIIETVPNFFDNTVITAV